MARHEMRKVGEGGDVVIPADFRRELGIEPGDLVEFEEREDGIFLRPARSAPRDRSRERDR